MIKVLLVARLHSGNRYTDDLYHQLIEQDINLDISEEAFWNTNKRYDVVHVEWIETLFNWQLKGLTQPDLMRLKFRLQTLKEQGTKLVITRHNKLPHAFQKDQSVQDLYKLIYQYTTAIVHLGEFSVRDFSEEQPEYAAKITHRVIGHGNYFSLKNTVTQKQARQALGIDPDRFVLVSFGALRHVSERSMMFEAFKAAQIPNKTLLVNRWKIKGERGGKIRDFIERVWVKYLKWRKEFVLLNIFTRDEDIQKYMNAADALVIPRVNTMNSGNLYLGLSFGKVIIAPNVGNINEVATQTGNLVYDPNDIKTLSQAMEQSVALSKTEVPLKNMDYAKKQCDWALLAKQHADLYMIISKTQTP